MSIKTNSPLAGRLALFDLVTNTAYTVTAEDSGKVFILGAIGAAITLPSPTLSNKGCWFRFVCGVKCVTTNWVITSQAADMHITIRSGGSAENNTLTSGDPDTAITFVNSAADEGDFVEMYSTGSVWMVTGACHATANITAA